MIWFVHRRQDNSIASAHSEPQPGYAEEQLDDQVDWDMRVYHALVTGQPAPEPDPVPEPAPEEEPIPDPEFEPDPE